MKTKYFLKDMDGADLDWSEMYVDRKIPVVVDSIALIPVGEEQELHIFLRSCIAKPTRRKSGWDPACTDDRGCPQPGHCKTQMVCPLRRD